MNSLLNAATISGHVQYLRETFAKLVQYETFNVLFRVILKFTFFSLSEHTAGSCFENLISEDVEWMAVGQGHSLVQIRQQKLLLLALTSHSSP